MFGERWSDLDETTRYEVAAELLPTGQAQAYNLALLDFASMVCTAPEPECERCPAIDHCRYYATKRSA